MHPEICRFGPLTIYSYGLMLAIAFAIGSSLMVVQARKQNIDPEAIFNLAFIVFVSGVAGARLFYVIANAPYYFENPLEIIMLQRGGLAWFGGMIAGTLAGIVYLIKKKLPVLQALDLFVPFAALGQAIGRIGCLLNGCCYGEESPSGLYFPAHEAILVPVQIYSSLALLIIFIILRFLQDRPHRQGQVFYAYLGLYSAKRFLIEFWRADNPTVFGGLTLFQVMCIPIFAFGIISLFLLKRTKT